MEHVRDAPQQRNGYDCGMYTVVLAELLASKALASTTAPQAEEAVSIGRARSDNVGGDSGRGGSSGSGSGGGGDARNSAAGSETVLAGGGDGDGEAVAVSPEFVSNARRVARERLSRCIGSYSWGCEPLRDPEAC